MRPSQSYAERFARTDAYLTRSLADGATHHQIAKALRISVARVGRLEQTGLARLRRCWELIDAGVPVDEAIEACRWRNGRQRKNRKGNS